MIAWKRTSSYNAHSIPAYLEQVFSSRPELVAVIGEIVNTYLEATKDFELSSFPKSKDIEKAVAQSWPWVFEDT